MPDYHIRRSEKEIVDPSEIKCILKNGRFATIAMAWENEPYLVTLNYGYDEARESLYFHCAMTGQKIDFLKSNKNVCATIIIDGGYIKGKCDHTFSSLVIRGEMTIVNDVEDKLHGLNILIQHLEDHPGLLIKAKYNDKLPHEKVNILCLKITGICGKENPCVG